MPLIGLFQDSLANQRAGIFYSRDFKTFQPFKHFSIKSEIKIVKHKKYEPSRKLMNNIDFRGVVP